MHSRLVVDDKQAANLAAFDREELIGEYSCTKLNVAEEELFRRYFRRGESVLDLACGAGRTSVRLEQMGLDVKGIDTSRTLIAAARKQYPAMDFQIGSYLQTPLPDGSYDHVLIAFNGLDYAYPEHCRLAAIRECHRVLKPGGTFIFSSHNIKWLHGAFWRMRLGSLGYKLWQTIRAFKARDYVYEASVGTYTFFGSPRYVIRQTEKVGFFPEEAIGLPRFWGAESYVCLPADPDRKSCMAQAERPALQNSYRCGHVYYVFRKV
jgi:SAM-dependent methyltransferase